jgi:molecular chaperone Hsp33
VKAYTSNPHAETRINEQKKLAVGESIGADGKVIVIRDYGMKEPFIGQSDLVSGEIAEDLAHYFVQSEQQPTAVGLGVFLSPDASVKSAGGFIVQLLPETKEETIDQLEANLSGMKSIPQLFEEGLTIEQIAGQVLAGLGLDELETYPLEYVCDCSREKMKTGMMSIGKPALQEILDEDGEAELICHFCNSKYLFAKEELIELLDQMEK